MTGASASSLSDDRIRRGMALQLEARAERVASGARPIGWKVGFGAPAALSRLQLPGPLIGFLTDATLLTSGASVSIGDWVRPVAEPEIAVYVGSRLGDGADERTVRASIRSLGAAIELADVFEETDDVERILASDIFHRGLVLGRPDPSLTGGRLEGLEARVTVDGDRLASTSELEALTGPLLEIVGYVAHYLAQVGGVLDAGDVVIAGSVVPPIPIRPGQELVYQLNPLDAISLTFA